MTLNEYKTTLDLLPSIDKAISSNEEEFSIPLDISDIISICRDYNSLGWQVQNQIGSILEAGVEEAIKSGHVKQDSLPHIKYFLRRICDNAYFGEAVIQAEECIQLILHYEEIHQINYSKAN